MKTLQQLYDKYSVLIQEAAEKYGLDEAMLAGLVFQESRGNWQAKSPCGAFGLTQVMPATAKDRGYDIGTPRGQVMAGADYLHWILKNFAGGDIIKALAGYNAGVGRLKNNAWQKFPETVHYVAVIPRYAEDYRAILKTANKEDSDVG